MTDRPKARPSRAGTDVVDGVALPGAAIQSHGGVVEKSIGYADVGVFGHPVAHVDDPERAVRETLQAHAYSLLLTA